MRLSTNTSAKVCKSFIQKIMKKYTNKITTSEYIIERLIYKNINTAFGYNGGAALPLFDAISKNDNFNMIFNRHEQSSGHCAESYAKITNNIGVLITTSGPGFTNVVTPLQDAYSDGIPLLCISCQVSSKVLGTDAFQESDTTGISKACVKDNYQVKSITDFPNIFEYLINLPEEPRKGPVHIDICKDILIQPIREGDLDYKTTTTTAPTTTTTTRLINYPTFLNNQLNKVITKIDKSKKPVLVVGAGATNNYLKVREFVKKFNIPVTTTLHGLGIVDEKDPLSLKMVGMHGSYQANMAMDNADLIVGIGNRFDDRTVGKLSHFAETAKKNHGIIHIDDSLQQLSKVEKIIEPTLSINCSTKQVLEYLLKNSQPLKQDHKYNRDLWIKEINRWKAVFKLKTKSDELTSNYILSTLSKTLEKYNNNNYILTTGVGSHQMVTAQYFDHKLPNSLLTSGSLGTMGVGLPFAIGAQIAKPDATVILIDGDGSFTMSMNEIASIIEYDLPIKLFVINDKKLQMVDYWQELLYDDNKVGSNFKYTPEFHKVAKAFNIKNLVCNKKQDVTKTIKAALTHNGPVLVDFIIDKSYCLPFVPPQTPLNEMILE